MKNIKRLLDRIDCTEKIPFKGKATFCHTDKYLMLITANGKIVLFELIHGSGRAGVDGIVGGYNSTSVIAAHMLEYLGKVPKGDGEKFEEWFFEQRDRKDKSNKLDAFKRLANELGYEVKKSGQKHNHST